MMAKRKISPSRQRYEADHPTLTVRIPAAVKTVIQQAAAGEGLSVSEWLQAQVAGHVTDAADAYQRGQHQGQLGGLYAGILLATWVRNAGKSHDLRFIHRMLNDHPDIRAITRQCCAERNYGARFDQWFRSVPPR